jgi:hypothetical protein
MLCKSLILAIAVLASCAPAAFAVESVEVSEDDVHCPEVSRDSHDAVTGGCEFRAVGQDIQMFSPTVSGEVLGATCDISAVINVDEDGNGYGSGVSVSGNTPCPSITNEFEIVEGASREMAWGVNIMETAPGQETIRLALEFVFFGTIHAPGDLYVTPNNDFTSVEVDSGEVGDTGREITGHWDLLKDGSNEPTDIVVSH